MNARSSEATFTVERDCLIDGVSYKRGDAVGAHVAIGWKRLSALMSSGLVTPSPDLYPPQQVGVVRRRPTARHLDASVRRSIVDNLAEIVSKDPEKQAKSRRAPRKPSDAKPS